MEKLGRLIEQSQEYSLACTAFRPTYPRMQRRRGTCVFQRRLLVQQRIQTTSVLHDADVVARFIEGDAFGEEEAVVIDAAFGGFGDDDAAVLVEFSAREQEAPSKRAKCLRTRSRSGRRVRDRRVHRNRRRGRCDAPRRSGDEHLWSVRVHRGVRAVAAQLDRAAFEQDPAEGFATGCAGSVHGGDPRRSPPVHRRRPPSTDPPGSGSSGDRQPRGTPTPTRG
jgi:hypothetical protein